MVVSIRDPQFVRKVEAERRRRGLKTMSKATMQLAEERLIELETQQFLSPPPTRRGDAKTKSNT